MRKIWIALLVMAPCLFAHGGENNCQEVGGAVLTNFLSTPAPGANTLGTATGELSSGSQSLRSHRPIPARARLWSSTSNTIG